MNGATTNTDRLNEFDFGPNVISGTVWNDANKDGMMGGAEAKLSGTTVNLYQDYASKKKILVATTTTADDGTYSFTAGTYKNQTSFAYTNLTAEVTVPSGMKSTIYSGSTDNVFAAGKTDVTTNQRGIAATLTGDVTNINAGLYTPVTLTYDGNDNTSGYAPVVPTEYASGDTVTVLDNTGATAATPAPYVKTGYTFSGWNTKADGTGTAYKAGDTFTITADTTLYAKWDQNKYTVKFATETGGTLAGNDDQTVMYNEHATKACTVTANTADYVFQGWKYEYVDANGVTQTGTVAETTIGTPDTNYTTMPISADTTFTALFAKKPYVASSTTNGYTAVAVSTDSASPAAAPAVTAATNASAKAEEITPLPASAGIVYKPVSDNYKATPTVTVQGLTGDPQTLTAGLNTFTPAGATDPITITLTIDSNTKVATVTTDAKINDSLTFKASYPAAQTTYTVKHYLQNTDGSWPTTPTDTVKSAEVDAGSALPDVSTLTKTYDGASLVTAKTTYADSATKAQAAALPAKADGSTVLSLYYGLSTLTVTFDANGHGAAPDSQSVFYGGKATDPGSLTATGYVFGGWYTSKDTQDDTTKYDFATAVTKDTTLYAKWTEAGAVELDYVSADTAKGTVDPASESVAPATGTAKGSKATPAAGYHFVKWTNNVDATTTTDATLSAAQVDVVAKASGIYVPVTFTANFAEDDVTINYVSADATMGTVDPATETVGAATGEAVGSKATPNEGYTFVSWTDAAGKVVSTDPAFVPAKVNGLNVAATYTANFVGKGKVSVVKSVDNANAKPGDTVTYTLTLTNTGTATSDHVWVKDYVPANTRFVSCDSLGTYNATTAGQEYVTWYVDPIDPNGTVTLTLSVKIAECQDGTIIPNVAYYKPTSTKPDPSTDPTGNGSTTTNTVNTTVSNPAVPAVTSVTPNTPASVTPKTGDRTSLVGMTALATFGLVAIVFGLRRKRREER